MVRRGSLWDVMGPCMVFPLGLAGAVLMVTAVPAMSGNAGSVTFTDDQHEKVVISRDLDPLTGTLTNTITVTHRDGTVETQIVSTTPDAYGGFDITRSDMHSGGTGDRSSSHVGASSSRGSPGGRGPTGTGGHGGGAGRGSR